MEELVESILDYIRADYTDYAIMINGEWGSGKTYFWNNKIRKKIDSMNFNGKKYTTIYMSLYGISNLEEISKKIFIETTQSTFLLKYGATLIVITELFMIFTIMVLYATMGAMAPTLIMLFLSPLLGGLITGKICRKYKKVKYTGWF